MDEDELTSSSSDDEQENVINCCYDTITTSNSTNISNNSQQENKVNTLTKRKLPAMEKEIESKQKKIIKNKIITKSLIPQKSKSSVTNATKDSENNISNNNPNTQCSNQNTNLTASITINNLQNEDEMEVDNNVQQMTNKTEDVKYPPILIKITNKLNINNVITDINKIKNNYILKFTTNYIIVNNIYKKDSKILKTYLDGNKLQYFTYTNKEDKLNKFVIKGLPNLDEKTVRDSLVSQGIEITKIAKMKAVTPNPIYCNYYIATSKQQPIADILNIKTVSNIIVKIEKYNNKNGVTQCYNCQSFGHGSANCHIKPKCVKCAGEHRTSECKKPAEEIPKCANCNLEHTANYNGCAAMQNYKISKQLKSQINAVNNITTTNRFALLQDSNEFPAITNTNNNNKNIRINNSNTSNTNSNQQTKHQYKMQQIQELKQHIHESNLQLQQLCSQAINEESIAPTYAEMAATASTSASSQQQQQQHQQQQHQQQQQNQQQQQQHTSKNQNPGESFSDLVNTAKTMMGFVKEISAFFGPDLRSLMSKCKDFIAILKNNQGNKLEAVFEFIQSLSYE